MLNVLPSEGRVMRSEEREEKVLVDGLVTVWSPSHVLSHCHVCQRMGISGLDLNDLKIRAVDRHCIRRSPCGRRLAVG